MSIMHSPRLLLSQNVHEYRIWISLPDLDPVSGSSSLIRLVSSPAQLVVEVRQLLQKSLVHLHTKYYPL